MRAHHGVPDGLLSSGKPVQEFHSDGLHELETPPIATSMSLTSTESRALIDASRYSVATPSAGGDTLFMSGFQIHEDLTSEAREQVGRMTAQYSRTPRAMHPSG